MIIRKIDISIVNIGNKRVVDQDQTSPCATYLIIRKIDISIVNIGNKRVCCVANIKFVFICILYSYALAEEEQELEALVESLDKTCTRYKMEISAEKTKLMTNCANGIQREIKVKGQKLGTVTSFKYLEAVVSDDGSKPEVLSRIAQATAALTKLKPIWRDNNISLGSKVKLMRSLVISIFLYACESWTLTAELEKRTQAFEMRCYRRLLNISYKDHVTNEEVRRKIQAAIGKYDELLTLVKKRKLRWFGHVSRSSGLAKTILQGTVKGKRKRGRQKKRWEDNIKEWTGMDFASSTRAAETGQDGKGLLQIHLWCPDDLPRLWDRIE